MDPDVYFRLLSRLRPRETHHALKLFWLGESFLHPDFHEILKGTWLHLEKHGHRHEYIDLHTNGHFLTDRMIALLLEIGDRLPRLTLSLDALTPEVHSRIRRRGNVEKVNASIQRFLERRADRGKSLPSLIFQFIIMPENARDAAPFVEHWTRVLDSLAGPLRPVRRLLDKVIRNEKRWFKDVIWLKRVDCAPRLRSMAEDVYRETIIAGGLYPRKTDNWELVASIDNLWENQRLHADSQRDDPVFDSDPLAPPTAGNDTPAGATLGAPRELLDNEANFYKEDDDRLLQEQTHRRPCAGPFKTPCIRWDGEVAVCCFDPAMQMGLGNLQDTPFDELWYGEQANKIRLAHIEGRFADIKTTDGFRKCLRCAGYDTPVVSDEEVLTFLTWLGRKELYPAYLKRIAGN